jgi:hypothetical protein
MQTALKSQVERCKEESFYGLKNSLVDLFMRPEYTTGNLIPYPFKKETKKEEEKGPF